MTGFGKATALLEGKSATIEIRSLNSKQLDLNLRIPPLLRDHESEIRSLVSRKVERGKTELVISIDYTGSDVPASINKPLAIAYYRELKALDQELNAGTNDLLSTVMKMPEVTKQGREELDDPEWLAVQNSLVQALDQLTTFRTHEGSILEQDFITRIGIIRSLLTRVEPFEAARNQQLKDKLRNNFSEFINNNSFDTNRFEQEMIYYLEKLDITEEKVRLAKHCDYFLETLTEEVAVGRKLAFVSQEIGREINTLGAKASDASIQKLVVEMKDELEKIKEQLANIL